MSGKNSRLKAKGSKKLPKAAPKEGGPLSAARYAALRGKSPAWVSEKIAAGMPAKPVQVAGGQGYEILPAAAIEWEVSNAREDRAPKKGSARDKLAREQAEKFALENAKARGELVPVDVVRTLLYAACADLSGRLNGSPGRMAGQFASAGSDPAAIRAMHLDENRAILAAFAEVVQELPERLPDLPDDGGDSDSAALEDGGGVGEREPDFAAGER
jgi:hypothetical protein